MVDIKQVHKFAVKWLKKFRMQNISYIELIDHQMADDCSAIGFEMDCGHAFGEKYGGAASSFEELKNVINDVTDISLLGSAIYSQWRYFNHWAYSGEEILEPKNRSWFITALSRLETLTESDDTKTNTIVLFPDLEKLKAEVEKLRKEASALLSEKDELLLVECKNIETAYLLTLGGLEYKAYELRCDVLRLKRKIGLIQSKKNRQEKIIVSDIEEILDEEFAEYKERLNEQLNRMNAALERSGGDVLSEKESKELKKLYHSVIKALHPDLHPDITDAKMALFHNAVTVYENGDLKSMRIISALLPESEFSGIKENSISVLTKERDRLIKLLGIIHDEISKIKNEYPYTMKKIVQNKEEITAKKTELETTILQLKDMLKTYKRKVTEMLR